MGSREGGCQCGRVRYRVNAEPIAVIACHCRDCQRQSGSAFGMSMVVPREAFEVLDGAPRSFERPADSGGSVECFFCADCGTRLYHRPSRMSDTVNVKPGTLDDTSWFEPRLHVWVARKQPWVPIPDAAPRLEGQPG